MRAIPAKGPLWDRSQACSCSTASHRVRNWSSNREAASCCQPRLATSSNSSASWVGGRKPFARSSHVGGLKTLDPNQFSRCPGCCMHFQSHFWVSLPNIGDTTRPPCSEKPDRWCEKHPEDPDLPWTEVTTLWPRESVPNTTMDRVVALRKMLNQFRSDDSHLGNSVRFMSHLRAEIHPPTTSWIPSSQENVRPRFCNRRLLLPEESMKILNLMSSPTARNSSPTSTFPSGIEPIPLVPCTSKMVWMSG